jgi:hypothetical protein
VTPVFKDYREILGQLESQVLREQPDRMVPKDFRVT